MRSYLVHPRRPAQVPPQVPMPLPRKSPEIAEADLVRVKAPVGLHTPSQIGTAPRAEPVAARETPQNPRHQLPAPLRAEVADFTLSGVA